MGLEALLTKLENREIATPETPCSPTGVAANPALSLACTLVTPETPQIDNGENNLRLGERINRAKPAPVPACKTCANVTGRGGCGKPVAAGLSDVVGVIRYSPNGGATCLVWLARLDVELERRNPAMAERLHYSGEELALALDGARSDPDGRRGVVDFDEIEGANDGDH